MRATSTRSRPRASSIGSSSSFRATSRSPSARALGSGLCAPEFAVMIAYTKNADIDRDARHRPARRSGARFGTAGVLPVRAARAVPRHAARASAASRDHHDVDGQHHGQPGRDQLRPSDDRGHRHRRSPTCCGRSSRPAGSSNSTTSGTRSRRSTGRCRSTRRSTCSSRRGARPNGRPGGCSAIGRPRSRSTSCVDEFAAPDRDHRRESSTASSPGALPRTSPSDGPIASRQASRPSSRPVPARWPWMHPGFDIVELAREQDCSVEHAMTAYWSMFEAFDLFWLWEGIGALPRPTAGRPRRARRCATTSWRCWPR